MTKMAYLKYLCTSFSFILKKKFLFEVPAFSILGYFYLQANILIYIYQSEVPGGEQGMHVAHTTYVCDPPGCST